MMSYLVLILGLGPLIFSKLRHFAFKLSSLCGRTHSSRVGILISNAHGNFSVGVENRDPLGKGLLRGSQRRGSGAEPRMPGKV